MKTKVRSKKTLTALDLFAGAGGFSLGLRASGFDVVGAIEIDSIAARSYTENFGSQGLHLFGPKSGNITKIDPTMVRDELTKRGIRELDLLVAGPPCQGFSKIGRGKLNSLAARTGAFLSDPRNRLYHRVIEFLRVLKPKSFIVENVPGMMNVQGNNIAEVLCEAASKAGYTVRATILNSAWYGAPQIRERVFVVGMRNDLRLTPTFPERRYNGASSTGHLSEAEFVEGLWERKEFFVPFKGIPSAHALIPATTVGEAFADIPEFLEHLRASRSGKVMRIKRELFGSLDYSTSEPPNDFCALMRSWIGFESHSVQDHFSRWTPRDFRTFARMKSGDRYPEAWKIAFRRWKVAKARYLRSGSTGRRPVKKDFVPPYSLEGFPDKWRKLFADRPSWTVTAHLSRDTYSHIHFDSKQARAITIREAARLQSFPDAFRFLGNMGDAFQQIGNAVPPFLAEALGAHVRKELERVPVNPKCSKNKWAPHRVPSTEVQINL